VTSKNEKIYLKNIKISFAYLILAANYNTIQKVPG